MPTGTQQGKGQDKSKSSGKSYNPRSKSSLQTAVVAVCECREVTVMKTNWEKGSRIHDRWEISEGPIFGGMGLVYIVYDHKHQAVYAAKTFRDNIFTRSPRIVDNFYNEARLWMSLDIHPNIVPALFVERIEGKPFVFMPYISGGDLSKWIGTPRLIGNFPQVLRFSIHLCEAMTHATSRGIIAHRDIKPQNCLVTDYGALMLSDFGLAKAAATGKGGFGTLEYMAPEQLDDPEGADERSDIYSFGALLYEMLIGQPPFGRRADVSEQELERKHKQETPPAFDYHHKAFDIAAIFSRKGAAPDPYSHATSFNSIVQTCLAKEPSERYQSFSVLRAELARVFQDLTGAKF